MSAHTNMESQPPMPSPWLTVEELAAYMKTSKRRVYEAVATGKLRAARLGERGDIRGRKEWCDAYLEACAPQEIK